MADTSSTPAATPPVKCPGWYHESDRAACDLDRKVHAWETRRQQTTIQEREGKRAELHARAGIFMPEET